jgi:hypothetical protein
MVFFNIPAPQQGSILGLCTGYIDNFQPYHVLKLSEIFYLEKILRNYTFISNIVHKFLKMHFMMLIGYI